MRQPKSINTTNTSICPFCNCTDIFSGSWSPEFCTNCHAVWFFGYWHEPSLVGDKPKWRRRRINIKRIGMIKPKDEGWVVSPPVERGFFDRHNWFQILYILGVLVFVAGSCTMFIRMGGG